MIRQIIFDATLSGQGLRTQSPMKIACLMVFLCVSCLAAIPVQAREDHENVNRILLADSLNKEANKAQFHDLDDLGRTYAEQAYAISNQIRYRRGQTDALSVLSAYYLIKGEYLKALELYFKSLDIYDQIEDTMNTVLVYDRIVNLYLVTKNYLLAEKYLNRLTVYCHKINDPKISGQVHLSIAKFHLAQGQKEAALRNAFISLYHLQNSENKALKSAVYKLLGDGYVQMTSYTHAIYNYNLATSLLSGLNADDEMAVLYTRLAHVYQELNKKTLALEFNIKALRFREKTGRQYLCALSFLNVGDAYFVLGKPDSAIFYLRKSQHIAEQMDRPRLLDVIYQRLFTIAKNEGNYEEALRYLTLCTEQRARLAREANRSEILVLEANRDIRASEAEDELLNQELRLQNLLLKKQRVQLFLFEVLFIILLAMSLVVDAVARRNRNRKNELKELNSRLTKEITVRIEAESRLRQSEELHRFLAEHMVDVISLMDGNMKRLYISPTCEKFYGYSAQEILRMPGPLSLVDPDFQALVGHRFLEMFKTKTFTSYIYKVRRKDSRTFWAEANINPILDPVTSEVKNMISVVRDISERKKNEENLAENARQKEYLLHEIHNRVKNNFAILISLMSMQNSRSSDPELANSLTELQLRVRTMSLVHEQLYSTKEINAIPFDSYLRHLAGIISGSFNNNRILLQADLQPCSVPIEMALPLGLILNEFITNAYKYAFPGNRTGTIQVKLNTEPDGKFSVAVCDDGIGLPADFNIKSTKSMGSQIIGILVEQIEATLEVSGNKGACFRIIFSTLHEK
jgi:PAS domain S-box-containing protein